MTNLQQSLDVAGGRPTGFDYLRIGLACAVVIVHSVGLSYGGDYADPFFQKPGAHAISMLILPMFFSLSGFLVTGSLDRCKTLFGFLGLRFIRIYPALAVEVLLSAFVLGPIFTTVAWRDYFTDPTFFRYLINVTGHISFYLPGVFLENPSPGMVNRQLWTVPFELYCYFALTILAFTRLARKAAFLLLAVVVFQLGLVARLAVFRPSSLLADEFPGHVAGPQLVIAFLAGVLVYRFRERLPSGRMPILVAGSLSIVLFSFPAGGFLGVFTAAYATICLGVLNPKKVGILRGADYSYGVYLYGWPIQQALVATGGWARHAIVNATASLIIAFAIAALSWHLIEKPALDLRGPLRRLEELWIRLWRRSPAAASRV